MEMTSVSRLLVAFCVLGAAQGFLFGFALITMRRGNKIAHRLLGSLVFVISIFLVGAVLRTTGYDLVVPHVGRVHDPFTFLAAPLLYLYLRALITKQGSFPRSSFLHFIPFGVCVLYLAPFYLLNTADKTQILLAEHQDTGLGDWYYTRSAVLIAYAFVYLVVSVWMLAAYRRRVRLQNKRLDRTVLLQIRFLIGGIVAIWIVGVLRYSLDSSSQTNLLVPALAALTVYGLGYIYLRDPGALSQAAESMKYEGSSLTADRADRYLERLREFMDAEKPFTDCELSLQKLAEQLSMPPQHLSQVINERLDRSFSDLINFYRVEEVKKVFLDPAKKHYSLLAISEEAGFNSKSSFNSVFKKYTGRTPSEYRNKLQLKAKKPTS